MKNCDRGLENAARGRRSRAAFSSPRSQFFTIRTDPKPRKKTRASVTVTVVRDRKIQTALRTNQIVGFVSVPAWRKIKCDIHPANSTELKLEVFYSVTVALTTFYDQRGRTLVFI